MISKKYKFHASRRNELMKLIGKGSAALIFSNTMRNSSYDQDYEFTQNRNFYYLTGFDEPDAALLLVPDGITVGMKDERNTSKKVREILFVRMKDQLMETWNGERLGHKNVKNVLGIEHGMPNISLTDCVYQNIFRSKNKLYLNLVDLYCLSGSMRKIVNPLVSDLHVYSSNIELIDVSYMLGRLRRKKTPYEIEMIKKAVDITGKGFRNAMKYIKPGNTEYQVQAAIEFGYKFNGASGLAYATIAASGNNACIMHYESNSEKLNSGDLILIDSGAHFDNYNADITRTYPVNGKFSKAQRFIYDIVLAANKECIKRVKPGAKMEDLRKFCYRFMAHKLAKTNVIKDVNMIKDYAIHPLGHHLGLDTHDAVPYSETSVCDYDKLMPGDVVTIEPGLYFRKDDKNVPAVFRGIGVRIEDDILITSAGAKNLSIGIPKDPDELEKLMWNKN